MRILFATDGSVAADRARDLLDGIPLPPDTYISVVGVRRHGAAARGLVVRARRHGDGIGHDHPRHRDGGRARRRPMTTSACSSTPRSPPWKPPAAAWSASSSTVTRVPRSSRGAGDGRGPGRGRQSRPRDDRVDAPGLRLTPRRVSCASARSSSRGARGCGPSSSRRTARRAPAARNRRWRPGRCSPRHGGQGHLRRPDRHARRRSAACPRLYDQVMEQYEEDVDKARARSGRRGRRGGPAPDRGRAAGDVRDRRRRSGRRDRARGSARGSDLIVTGTHGAPACRGCCSAASPATSRGTPRRPCSSCALRRPDRRAGKRPPTTSVPARAQPSRRSSTSWTAPSRIRQPRTERSPLTGSASASASETRM